MLKGYFLGKLPPPPQALPSVPTPRATSTTLPPSQAPQAAPAPFQQQPRAMSAAPEQLKPPPQAMPLR